MPIPQALRTSNRYEVFDASNGRALHPAGLRAKPLKPRQVVRKAAELTGWSEEDQQAVAQKLQLPGPDCPGSMCFRM